MQHIMSLFGAFARKTVMLAGTAVLGLAGCGGGNGPIRPASMDITLLGFNDFHGNLEPPRQAVTARDGAGRDVAVPAGGAAYLASVIAERRAANAHVAVVTAGDNIGASPMISSLFLDEPTIEAFNLMRIDFAATGNHEYDQGWRELLRMQHGGCEKYTLKTPCQISQAPPISASAATTNSKIDLSTVMPGEPSTTVAFRFDLGRVSGQLGRWWGPTLRRWVMICVWRRCRTGRMTWRSLVP